MNLKWKGKDKDHNTLNLTLILQVDISFVVGTFFLSQEKHLSSRKL